MKRQYSIIPVGIILFIALLFNSCNMEYIEFDKISKDTRLNTRYAGPLVHGRVNIGDILNRFDDDDDVQVYDNGLLYLVYKNSTYSRRMDEIIVLQDQNYTESFVESDPDMPDEPYETKETITRTRYFVMAFNNDEKLDSIWLDNGLLEIDVDNSFIHHTAQLNISSSNIRLGNGQTLNKNMRISPNNYDENLSVPLDNSTLAFDHFDTSTAVSYIPVTFTLELSGNSSTGPALDESVDIDIGLKNLDYNALFGNLGSQLMLDSNDNIEVQIFDDYPLDGKIEYADPRFFISTKNSIGATIDLDISNITTNTGTDMEFSAGVNPFTLKGPAYNEIGREKDTTFYINKDKCPNIVEAMSKKPKSVRYNARANINTSDSRDNFALDSSRLAIGVAVELPLNVWTDEIILQDTGDFELKDILFNDTVTVRKALIRIENINGLPADIRSQVVLVDSNYNEVDSLFVGKKNMLITKAAKVDENGDVTEPTTNSVDIEIYDTARFNKWKDVEYTLSRIYCTTAGAEDDSKPTVKFHVDDEVIIKVGVDAHFTIE